ncbi:hypothetical protein CO009_01665 [Candidatus Shapirobacteria bacterium CG_4_8_14_3_um_filter_35_11]|uniref:Glycosyltransferase RgtA/B/C/D-like domain-containing protein n=3 Tax=Candidatus Shapironibacteriota TaxID=1752721 RepID=A0A2M7XMU2_9BACT|nr:MAG: hypothetical protein COS53_01470 [Candidatus Shapirobacteria bacterium CG03_land_8_20_14_0_80_35_14]PJA50897.1 MAG: hypothetical protein CO168_02670 [Candidatus Shapirobacteria bacterium CG_4_9_14_3_um_filter_36_12]PJC80569.1 MAG: hypothetical protein CO009_01665 [Candidatus Shapirobacteria bacterium CG_4_8_14_3_um_filter_35_11]
MKKILWLAVTIYLIIAPITYHPDTKLVLYYATVGKEKVWNIYKYLNKNIDSAPKFHYPPMNYWIVKAELPLVKMVGGSEIVKWLGTGGNIAFLDKNIFLYNLATKLPLLIMIFLTGYMIYEIAKKAGFSENRSRLAVLIWYLNPITIYSGVMMGQNDILAILPFIFGLYFYYDYPILAFLLFGLGGSIKSFPLIWAIALAGVYPTKNFLNKVFLMIISLLVYGVTLLPFIKYDYFVTDVMRSGLAMRMFDSSINLGWGIKLMVVPLLLIVVTLVGIKNNIGKDYLGLSKLLVAINFIVLGFSNFNPQWFIWIMPFFSIVISVTSEYWSLAFILPALMGIILSFNDKFLYWGLGSPINHNLINLPYVSEIFNIKYLNNLSHFVIMTIAIYWLYLCAKFKK